MKSMRILFLTLAFASISGPSVADSTFNQLLNNLVTEQSRCAGLGGDFSGMTCDAGHSNFKWTDKNNWKDIRDELNKFWAREYAKAICLLIIARDFRTYDEIAKFTKEYSAKYRPEKLVVFGNPNGRYRVYGNGRNTYPTGRGRGQTYMLTEGFQQNFIGHRGNVDPLIRTGRMPRKASCVHLSKEEIQGNYGGFGKPIASTISRTGTGTNIQFQWEGEIGFLRAMGAEN